MVKKWPSYGQFIPRNWKSWFCLKIKEFSIILHFLTLDGHNFVISWPIFKILVPIYIHGFSGIQHQALMDLKMQNIIDIGTKSQKTQFSWIHLFQLQTCIKRTKIHQISISRTVLESSECVDFKTVPKLANMSKNGWDTGLSKYFFRKVVWVKTHLNKGKLLKFDQTLNDHISAIFQLFWDLSSS